MIWTHCRAGTAHCSKGPPVFLKKLFYVSAALLFLSAAYHLGASTATAQGAGGTAVAMAPEGGGYMLALTANGDLYRAQGGTRTYNFEFVGNIFSGPPTPTTTTSFGALKVKYR